MIEWQKNVEKGIGPILLRGEMKRIIFIAFALAFILAATACSPTKEELATQAAVHSSQTATLWTPTATFTQPATRTATPTKTPVPSNTLAPTDTPAPIDTPTTQLTRKPVDKSIPEKSGFTTQQPETGRYYEENGAANFSYIPPKGWKQATQTAGKIAGWLGPTQTGGMICGLGFTVEEKDISAGELVRQALTDMPDDGTITLVEEAPFVTLAGVDAHKIIIRGKMGESDLLVGSYVFSQNGYLIITVYIRLADQNPEQDAIIEESLVTLRFEE